jgi:ribonuclease E
MGNKMLIDATHPEETRVVVTRGNRVEEFDYESAARKQLRGNIYLAKVARIEPSLQAAFVNYGGNRHGFLAFSEIHPDYYQIPVAVREAMLKEDALEREARSQESANGEARDETQPGTDFEEAAASEPQTDLAGEQEGKAAPASEGGAAEAESEFAQPTADHGPGVREAVVPLEAALPRVVYEEFIEAVARGEQARDEIPAHPDDIAKDERASDAAGEAPSLDLAGEAQDQAFEPGGRHEKSEQDEAAGSWESGSASGEGGVITIPEAATPALVEVVGSEDALEELPQRAKRRWRHYKIQEVIKRNQIVLIQVVKEERGTKGAALTTYLSLAGRYTVLMPNTASGGGISRKITVPADRKRLKEIAQELEVPEGMGLIIRTAGASRTKAEIKRDFEYLLRLWENVRDLTLKSTAPCLVYEEGDLIKRSIRDLYNKDIDEILVAGDAAHREAKEFMRMLMPSHAKNVQLYKDPEPLFTRYEVERQLNQMFSPVVTLRSGGYIVLNQTEALVAIDVNSGRATREYSIEDTALKTNLEAAEEIARQVRLRDLAGLIVIDFIDMDERRNNRAVERKLKECLRHDRARIQVGHISHFGLLEMSRQRLRQGVVEVSTMPCPTCQGVGHIRSTESVALMILRSIEDHLRTQGAANITASASPEAALYILNHKRAYLHDIETRYRVTIFVTADEKARGAHFAIERGAEVSVPSAEEPKAIHMDRTHHEDRDEDEGEEVSAEGEDKRASRRKRRRRRGRGDHAFERGLPIQPTAAARAESADAAQAAVEVPPQLEEAAEVTGTSEMAAAEAETAPFVEDKDAVAAAALAGEDRSRRNRRRGRRGGRRHRPEAAALGAELAQPLPGFGEQPEVNFDHHFPLAIAYNGFARKEERVAEGEPSLGEQPEHLARKPDVQAPLPETVEAIQQPAEPQPVLAQEVEAPTESVTEAAHPAPAEEVSAKVLPAPAPKPRPVRTGPARKGWWQRKSV